MHLFGTLYASQLNINLSRKNYCFSKTIVFRNLLSISGLAILWKKILIDHRAFNPELPGPTEDEVRPGNACPGEGRNDSRPRKERRVKKKRDNVKSKLANFISGLTSGLFNQPNEMAYARVRLPVSQPRIKRLAHRKR